jgi:hypothetical protein
MADDDSEVSPPSSLDAPSIQQAVAASIHLVCKHPLLLLVMCLASQAQQSPQCIESVWPLAALSSVAVRMPQRLLLMAHGIVHIAMHNT